jgi:nicotinamidase-related amidase
MDLEQSLIECLMIIGNNLKGFYLQDYLMNIIVFDTLIQNRVQTNKNSQQVIKDNQFIVFTRDTHYVDYLETREGKHLPIPHCIFGTNGYKLIPEIMELIKSYSNIAFIYKADGFGIISSEIPTEVRLPIYNAKDGFEICGLVTNMCVLSIAVSLQNIYNNLEITIDASCCASFNKELHEKALDIMEGLQMNIINR